MVTAKTIKIKLVKSVISIQKDQKRTVSGLGLKKINQVVELEDTQSVRGMVNKVAHLLKIL